MPHTCRKRQITNEIWQQAVRIAIDYRDLIPVRLTMNTVIRIIYSANIPVVDDGRVNHTHV